MNSAKLEIALKDAEATKALGHKLAKVLKAQLPQTQVVYLHGELGAGKTTLVAGVLAGLGHQGSTKSPTYTLVEPYNIGGLNAYHFDLYRLSDPEELEFIGIREYLDQSSILLVEWPQKGAGILPAADLNISLEYVGEQRKATISSDKPDLAARIADIV